MKTKLCLSLLLSFIFGLLSSQVPQGFNYQAVARDGTGNILPNKPLQVMLYIQSLSTGGTIFWKELHNPVTTNDFGMFTVVLGTGVRQTGSTVASFNLIDWKVAPKYLKTEIFYDGVWKDMVPATQLWSVPYSMTASDLGGSVKKLAVKGETSQFDEALFEVKNKNNQTVFAVYNEGVRVYVDDGAKGKRGGFAVGGFGTDKATSQRYMYIAGDSIRMYIDDIAGKKSRGGFAVGGFDQTKGNNTEFLNVATTEDGILNPSENRVLWYPLKNAFLVGKVLVESPDSVGLNSFTSGYESQASGDWSQALGFKTSARGDYSTVIGKNSNANGLNSFAFGNTANAKANDSYAIGTGAVATGPKSFAIGSSRLNDSTGTVIRTTASGEGAFALGFGSVASDVGAFAMGVLDSAKAPGSLSMGYYNRSRGWVSTTLGAGNIVEANGSAALAAGIWTKAGNWAASAFGDQTYASGHTSFATGFMTVAKGQLSSTFGDQTIAQSYGSIALGRYNIATGNSGTWVSTDPVFAIGNGTSPTARANALTVFKNGNMDLARTLNLNNVVSSGIALRVYDREALWYDYTTSTFSWGFGASYNVFAGHVSVGTTAASGYSLYVAGNAYSTGSWGGSDARWKKDLEQIHNTLPNVLKLQGYKYNWRDDEFPERNFDKERQIGLVAQDVEKIFPELVRTDDEGYKAVSYEKLTVILLESLKEQQRQIDAQNERIEKLEKLVKGKRGR